MELCNDITVDDYERAKHSKDVSIIAQIFKNRLHERYVKPHLFPNRDFIENYKHGFTIIATSCLLIESYMAYRLGLNTTKNRGREIFCIFFETEPRFSVLKDLRRNAHGHYISDGKPSRFYTDVRCGILHQGETINGWTISRKKEVAMIDPDNLKINTFKFLIELNLLISEHAANIAKSSYEDEIVQNVITKLDENVNNCIFKPLT